MKTFQFECAYCRKRYKGEKTFLKHVCQVKARVAELKTFTGQRALEVYKVFIKLKFGKHADSKSFINSQYYKSFHHFIEFSDKMGLLDIEIYIQVMNSKKLLPPQWTDPLAYGFYLENIDKFIKPSKQIEISVNTIMDWCEELNEDTANFYELVSPFELLELLTSRELSPWLVLNSKKFMIFYKNDLSAHIRGKISELIDGRHWSTKMKMNPDYAKLAKKCNDELML